MESEHFSLCWKNYHVNLSSGFHELLQSEYLVDVTLAVEGKFIKAHKTILSICSPYFQQLFKVNPCKHPIVIMHGMNYSTLYNILQFMYKGEVSVRQEEIPQFLKIADTLKVKGLTERDNDNAQQSSNGVNSSAIPTERQSQLMKRSKPLKPKPYTKREPSPATVPTAQPSATVEIVPSPTEPSTTINTPANETPVVPKEEPADANDESDYYSSTIDDHSSMDVTNMLDTQLGEPSHLKNENSFAHLKNEDGFFRSQQDTATSDYEYEFTPSRKGVPHLIYLDNLYRPSGKSASVTTTFTTGCGFGAGLFDSGSNSISMTHPRRYWECVKNRKTGCKARLLSRMGIVEVKFDQHNHASQADYIEERKRTGVTYKMSI